jgi:cytochrome c-type biogenesis protein CcmH
MRRALALALAGVLLAAVAAPGVALAARAKVDLVDIEDEVMCVDCGIPLNTAEGAQPDSERDLIRSLIAQGLTKAQIKQRLVDEYGPDVLALPDTSGVGITAYAIPIVLGAIVLAALVLLVPRWRRRPAAGMAGGGGAAGSEGPAPAAGSAGSTDDAAVVLSDADAARLDADLARYDG